jgi:hypothetical protein
LKSGWRLLIVTDPETNAEGLTVGQILAGLVRHPVPRLVRRWNWKSALLSSIVRSALFFWANLDAGAAAARAALLTELLLRGTTAGFYGALTQAFRPARPEWAGTLAALLVLPAASHLGEFGVHWLGGTPRLAASIGASVTFTVVSTAFNLFAMRRGALIVGAGSDSIWSDLRRTPRLLVAFVGVGCGAIHRIIRRRCRTLSTVS